MTRPRSALAVGVSVRLVTVVAAVVWAAVIHTVTDAAGDSGRRAVASQAGTVAVASAAVMKAAHAVDANLMKQEAQEGSAVCHKE